MTSTFQASVASSAPADRAVRIGATTYVYPTGWLDNVRRLAFRVDDISLLFYDAESPPADEELRGLADVKQRTQLSYTVHLPTDVSITHRSWLRRRSAVRTLKRLVQRTRPLDPERYVLRLQPPSDDDPTTPERWAKRAQRGLQALQRAGVSSQRLCLLPAGDNLEAVARLAETLDARLALDVGRLEAEDRDWHARVESHLHRTALMLWYGHDADEHPFRSIAFFPARDAAWLLRTLRTRGYKGVLALHVYKQNDFDESLSKVLQGGPFGRPPDA